MAVCNDYGFDIDVQICAEGPIGGGDSSQLRVRILNNAASSQKVLKKNGFDGNHTFDDWADSGSLFSCNIIDSSLTVSTTGNDDELDVQFSVTVNNCPGFSSLYSECDGPGPHTLTGSQTVPILVGKSCPF